VKAVKKHRSDMALSGRQSGDEHDELPRARRAGIESLEDRNFVVLALHQVVHRIAWVFKTETVIIPAFLDSVAGAGWVRGCLPVLNRFGQSVPQAIFSRRLKQMPRKVWALFGATLGMAAAMFAVAACCFAADGERPAWMAPTFLVLYPLFFMFAGLNQLSYGTVQGKLIRPARQGRLLAVSSAIGATAAIVVAWLLLGRWLAIARGGFGYIFGFTGICFAGSALVLLGIAEPIDQDAAAEVGLREYLADSWRLLGHDGNLRRLIAVAMLFATVLILFPHYQALARARLQLTEANLMVWVVAQNAALGGFSLLFGTLADRHGNRPALCLLLAIASLTPVLAVTLAHVDPTWGRRLFPAVFMALGATPVIVKTLTNYTLEVSAVAEHPRYLSTLNLGLAAPFCLSPVVGLLVDLINFEAVLLAGAIVIGSGGLLSLRLVEPRSNALERKFRGKPFDR